MKHYFFHLFFAVWVIAGCNSADKPEITDNTDLTETALPTGKYVLDDADNININDPNSGGFNKIGNKRDKKTTDDKNTKSRLTDLKKRYKSLLLFHASDTMKINKSYLATLVLGKDQVLGELKTELIADTKADIDEITEDTTLELGSQMKAKLIDMGGSEEKGFLIEMIGGDEAANQVITNQRKKVTWQWKLTPQATGVQHLMLSVSITEKDGVKVNLPAREFPITIFAQNNAIVSFFKQYGQWVIASILIPIFIAWLTTRMRNRSYDHHQNSKPKEGQLNNVTAAVEQDLTKKTEPVVPADPPNLKNGT